MKIQEVKFLKSITENEEDIFPLIDKNKKYQILFLGRSNVGKSSVISSLLGKKDLAHSSAKAGKTKTINIFEVNKDFQCLDFPGYGFARGNKENKDKLRDIILNYLQSNVSKNLKAVIILDAFVGPTVLDKEVFDYIDEKGTQILLILNKVDKVKRQELEKTILKVKEYFGNTKYIFYSCKTNNYREDSLKLVFER
ncbi:MAG: ribosome biogenesis GTP-binding protein YihA/YsxC [Candidatus Gracilibacteria bacterium]|nr:ribosome biogenesis GTP-binding protein YihA/YsxC [Candidatus Gracilibacteria bacterium]